MALMPLAAVVACDKIGRGLWPSRRERQYFGANGEAVTEEYFVWKKAPPEEGRGE